MGASFPSEFLWGAATSAYQIEGSPLSDGAGESIWHRFSHTPGKIADGTNGDLACDHFRRFAEDVRLMRDLGLQAYRFSTSWPRVLPVGTGQVNQRGLDFYSRLVDTLLECNIQPSLTLYHWDLPAALEDRGGWTNPQIADWFAEYARTMHGALGDRVRMWTTINEPWVVMDLGYVEGRHAPGRRNLAEAAAVSKNLLRAHGAAVAALRAEGAQQVAYLNRHFLDPPLLGQVPPELADIFGAAWPHWTDEELRQVRQPIDFVGVNYYLRLVVRDDPSAGAARARAVPQKNCPYTAMEWEIYPQGLTDTLLWLRERYGEIVLYITENGAAFDDLWNGSALADDPQRVEYLRSHLRAARDATAAGVDLRGYFVWSLLDNFEWQCGYSKRFGIVYVDFATQRRIPKASAKFYSDVIRSGGAILNG
jgi:beta-glucosidase